VPAQWHVCHAIGFPLTKTLATTMAASAPLQILLFRHAQDESSAPFEEAVVRAFQGGKDVGGYVATGEDLGVQLKVFSDAPSDPAAEVLDSFCHTLTLVLADTALVHRDRQALHDWLAACWARSDASRGRHRMIVIPMEERIGAQFSSLPGLETLQTRPVQTLGEYAIRPAMVGLLALHEARVLLAEGLGQRDTSGQPAGRLRLFISHAKIDGLPLAQALQHQIKSIGWLSSFYDAEDLPPGCNWQQELERGVGSSLIVILRTEIYDSRHWCQMEVRWADEYAAPAVLVEARTGLNHPAAALPFGRAPTVRIPDGNLLRVLFLALREGLKFLLFERMVEEMKRTKALPDGIELRVFCFPPSMRALLKACQSLASSASPPTAQRIILYPDPPLGTGDYEAAQALVAAQAPGVQLVTPKTLTVTQGAT
jgi:hypothetical protein